MLVFHWKPFLRTNAEVVTFKQCSKTNATLSVGVQGKDTSEYEVSQVAVKSHLWLGNDVFPCAQHLLVDQV